MGAFGHVVGAIFWAIGCVIFVGIIVALMILLVRFLLVGTRAAQLYIDANRPATGVTPAPSTTSTSPMTTSTPADSTPAAATPTAPVKPTPKPRTPKTPPSPDL